MLKLLGKFLLTLICINFSFAASAFVSNDTVILGDMVVLSIKADGKDVEFPDIDAIDGNEIVSSSSYQSIQNINGKVTRNIRKEYRFYPMSDMIIPSYEVKVDGKVEKTNEISLHVKKQSQTQDNSFTLTMQVNNQSPYVNEGVSLSFIFKMKKDIDVVDLRFAQPDFTGFWVKEGKKTKAVMDGEYVIQKINYIIFPQRSGDIKLKPARLDVGLEDISRDMFNMLSRKAKWRRVFSNEEVLHVKPLNGTKYIGEFSIDLQVDKTNVKANESVNATLKLEGYGNFDDIGEFDIQSKANIFKDKASIKTDVDEDKLEGVYEQKISFSSDKDFVIEPIEFVYFSKKDNILKTIKTKRVAIKVDSSQKENDIYIKSDDVKTNTEVKTVYVNQYNKLWIGFILGVLLCFFIFILYKYKNIFKYQKIENEKELLKKLLAINNEQAREYIKHIEESLYGNKTPLNKKEINKFIKSCEE